MKQKWTEQQRSDSVSSHRSALQISAVRQDAAILTVLDSTIGQEQFSIFPKGKFRLSKDGYEGEAELILVSRKQEKRRQVNATHEQNIKQQLAQKEIDQTKYHASQQLTSKWKIGNSLSYWLGIAILLIWCVWLLRTRIKSLLNFRS